MPTEPGEEHDAVVIDSLVKHYGKLVAVDGLNLRISLGAATLRPLLVDCGMCALFALAISCVALMVGRTRARAAV
ncbi:hypothetical protein [Actinomyces trachealis]|uniref:hypothetical protein n=1 Tax=Actinomyces trachealis TaxID=2763540 RepID=UPI001892A4C7|nr:hypothetical protein [Actinomyces trachealis]